MRRDGSICLNWYTRTVTRVVRGLRLVLAERHVSACKHACICGLLREYACALHLPSPSLAMHACPPGFHANEMNIRPKF